MKGKKKWLMLVLAVAAATLGVVQPALAPLVPVVGQVLGVPLAEPDPLPKP